MDPDFPGVHIGDWTGTVSQIYNERPTTYLIQWHPETLERVHPACREYCEVEDVSLNQMWLLEEDLEIYSAPPGPSKRRADSTSHVLVC
jgi:hypothetical protein